MSTISEPLLDDESQTVDSVISSSTNELADDIDSSSDSTNQAQDGKTKTVYTFGKDSKTKKAKPEEKKKQSRATEKLLFFVEEKAIFYHIFPKIKKDKFLTPLSNSQKKGPEK